MYVNLNSEWNTVPLVLFEGLQLNHPKTSWIFETNLSKNSNLYLGEILSNTLFYLDKLIIQKLTAERVNTAKKSVDR